MAGFPQTIDELLAFGTTGQGADKTFGLMRCIFLHRGRHEFHPDSVCGARGGINRRFRARRKHSSGERGDYRQ
jgi:hypothetical protein